MHRGKASDLAALCRATAPPADGGPVGARAGGPCRLDSAGVSEPVYRQLQRRVMRRAFGVHQRRNPPDIARHLGVTRLPVPDAVNRLVGEGMVTVKPRRGTAVSGRLPDRRRQVFDGRRTVGSCGYAGACPP